VAEGIAAGAERLSEAIEKLDDLVEPAGEPENSVLVDDARIVRWAGPAFIGFSLALLPWTAYLGYTLPSRESSPHYDVAWAGFDILLLITLGSAGYFALRRSRYLSTAAMMTATLLVVDAWFDIMTSPASQLAQAIVLALLLELPLAAVCAWLSYHTQQLAERRIVLLLRRQPSLRRRL
jgi:hypothetical protein